MATESFTSWDFANTHVQQDLRGGQFISAESTLIGAGPPNLSETATGSLAAGTGATDIFPIGVLESVAVQQNKQLQRIFEIGSSRSYFIPGRTIGSLSIGRTFYFGPSLLKAMYAHYDLGADIPKLTVTAQETISALTRVPGYGNFLIDLASSLFSQPTGLCVYFKSPQGDTMGAFYMNETYVQGHQMTISSGSVLIMEGVSAQFDSISPIKTIATTVTVADSVSTV